MECTEECPKGTTFVAGVGACVALTYSDDSNSCKGKAFNPLEVLNPINVLSGEKVQTFTDFNQSSLFSFKRDYASRRHETPGIKRIKRSMEEGSTYTVKQPEGYKGPPPNFLDKENENALKKGFQQWQHNFDLRLRSYEEKGTLQVTITLGKGKTRSFKFNETTLTYDPFLGAGDSLIKNGSDWVYTSPNNTYYTINALGKLVNISSPNGEKLTLTYNADDRLETVTNLHGKTLRFSYVGYLLTALTLPDNTQISYEFDKYENLISANYPDGTKEIYHYEDLVNHYALTGITGRDGIRYGNWSYNSSGIAMSSDHALGADAGTITYDGDNKTVEVTSVSGKTKKITFNKYGRVIKTIGETCSSDGVDGKVTYKYDRYGRLEYKFDANGEIERRRYTRSGQLSSIQNARGKSETTSKSFSYKAGTNLLSSIRQVNGLIEEFTYDDFGHVLTHTQKDGTNVRTTTYQYNAAGLLSRVDGPRDDVSDITTYQYDANNYLSSVTNALGHKTQFADYNGFGKATKITDSNGVVTNLTFDVNGRLTKMTQAGRVTSYVYDALGQIKQLTSGGTQVHYEYDAARRLTAIEDNQGNRIELTVDLAGNITQRDIKGSDKVITFTQKQVFDTINRLEKTTNATGQSWTNEYDVGSNLVKQISPDNTEVESSFDVLKRATQTLDQADSATGFEYNKLDQLTKVTDALGRSTTYEYNKFGELTKQTSPDSGITSFTYDKAGNMLTKTDARNITTSYSYDALNRPLTVDYVGFGSDIDIQFEYDNEHKTYGIGRLTQVTDETGSTAYDYNGHGELIRQTTEIQQADGGVNSYSLDYHYTQFGQLARITYPSGRNIHYRYNSLGQPEQLSTSFNDEQYILADNIAYLPFGPLTQFIYGNGVAFTNRFDKNYRLIEKEIKNASNTIISNQYDYNPLNNIKQINDITTQAIQQTFDYDAVQRLTNATGSYGELTYSYDDIGNRIEKTSGQNTTQYSYQNNSQLSDLTGAKTVSMQYDAAGNLIQKGSTTFSYNAAGRLSSATINGNTTAYQYNYLGQRNIKLTAEGHEVYYVYDTAGQLISEFNTTNNSLTEYVYLNGQRMAFIVSAGGTSTDTDDDSAPAITSNDDCPEPLDNGRGGNEISRCNNDTPPTDPPGDTGEDDQDGSGTVIPSDPDCIPAEDNGRGETPEPECEDDPAPENPGTGETGSDTDAPGAVVVTDTDLNCIIDENAGRDEQQSVDCTELPHIKWNLVDITSTPSVYYVHTNHIEAPLALSNANGVTVWQANYTPFGEAEIVINTINEELKARFPGQYHDVESGLYYNYFRDYDPELGRYIQSDPIGLAGGINTYGYVGGNPIGLIDPYGLSSCYTLNTLFAELSICVGNPNEDDGIIIPIIPIHNEAAGGEKRVDDPKADTEYGYYKAVCKPKLPPSGDKCQDFRNQQQQAQMCAELRQQWDDKWWPGRHTIEIMKEVRRAQKFRKLAEQCEKEKCN